MGYIPKMFKWFYHYFKIVIMSYVTYSKIYAPNLKPFFTYEEIFQEIDTTLVEKRNYLVWTNKNLV